MMMPWLDCTVNISFRFFVSIDLHTGLFELSTAVDNMFITFFPRINPQRTQYRRRLWKNCGAMLLRKSKSKLENKILTPGLNQFDASHESRTNCNKKFLESPP